MTPGYFHAACHKDQNEGKSPYPGSRRCNETFTDREEYVAHFREFHPATYRARPKSPEMVRPRTRPWGAPAVKYEKQSITPGTEFTHNGRSCQVIGAASSTRTRFLVWLPEESDPQNSTARHVPGQAEDGMLMWEVTAPTADVVKAVGENEE